MPRGLQVSRRSPSRLGDRPDRRRRCGIVDTGVVDIATAPLALVGFLALNVWHGKLTVLYVVLGGGAVGAALQFSGLS